METSILQSLERTKDKVRVILQEYPETRNNDNLLCSIYWREADGVEDLAGVQFATSAEAIRRSRQKINEDGDLLATDPDVLRRRRQLSHEIRRGIVHI